MTIPATAPPESPDDEEDVGKPTSTPAKSLAPICNEEKL